MFVLLLLKLNTLAAVLILLTLLLSRILKNRYSVRWKYWTWLVISLFMLLPLQIKLITPLVELTVPQEIVMPVNEGHSNPERSYDTSTALETPTDNTTTLYDDGFRMPVQSQENEKPVSVDDSNASLSFAELEKWVVCIWPVGATFVLVIRMLQYTAVKRKLGKYRKRIDAQEALSIYVRLCRQMGIRKFPVLYQQPDLQSPLLTGLFKPSLYLPKETYTAVELELIFLHELHHFRHKDLWYKFFLSIPGILYWFNPAIAVMRREANRDLEAICDSEVIRFTGTPQKSKAYGRLLLQTSMEPGFIRQASMGLNDSVTDFKERIKYMLSAKNRKNGIAVCLVLICSLLLANQLVGCSPATAEYGSDSDSAQTEASAAENISASQISELSAESTSTTESVSTPQTTDLSAESPSTTESVSTSQTAGLTMYETDNFTFTVPEIWQGKVTGRIEKKGDFESLVLEWKGILIASIGVEKKASSVAGDIGNSNIWLSRGQNSNYWVNMGIYNFAFLIPGADKHSDETSSMLNALTDEEKDQLLYLTTGGRITLEEVMNWVQNIDTAVQTFKKTSEFYEESIVPCIDVKYLPPRETDTAAAEISTFETRNFSFTIPKIWQGKVTGRLEGTADSESLRLEWYGIHFATIQVEEAAYTNDGSTKGYCKVWRSEEQNGYQLAIKTYNFACELGYHELYNYSYPETDGLPDEDKKELLYLTTGGKLTLEEATELCRSEDTVEQTYEKMVDFYNEVIVPNIIIKELP